MLDIHITEFFNDSARILLNLYRAFPRQIPLYVEDISGVDQSDEYGMHSERHLACFHTFIWLKEEGLLRYADVDRQISFDHCVLTLEGFRWLSDFDYDGGAKFIDALELAVKESDSNLTEQLMKSILRAQSNIIHNR